MDIAQVFDMGKYQQIDFEANIVPGATLAIASRVFGMIIRQCHQYFSHQNLSHAVIAAVHDILGSYCR